MKEESSRSGGGKERRSPNRSNSRVAHELLNSRARESRITIAQWNWANLKWLNIWGQARHADRWKKSKSDWMSKLTQTASSPPNVHQTGWRNRNFSLPVVGRLSSIWTKIKIVIEQRRVKFLQLSCIHSSASLKLLDIWPHWNAWRSSKARLYKSGEFYHWINFDVRNGQKGEEKWRKHFFPQISSNFPAGSVVTSQQWLTGIEKSSWLVSR